ncbi:phage portal protein [Mesorhizobium retamae]|uniref:Phage portal protein n=1 Tax=Mesorhizobium retamae TaxID=2912854 RepID=A0ABS9QN95_9HYPH|nr:phage portal protein [Mesorhizobium sp. IRAMC:0171]MCG7508877.1 phage portal protein [Mesorhizobium sp. IRAMC:0171]
MRFLGFNITRATKSLSPAMPSRAGGLWRVLESFPGAWQRNVEVKRDSVLFNHADFACRTLIASDIAKLRVKLVINTGDDIWQETSNPAYSPVIRKPNHLQNQIQFFESWVLSKLQSGNTYVLKQRDGRGVVTRLFVLDPNLVTPLVSSDGEVFYRLNTDNLAGLPEQIIVPAREIIHDRFNCFFHPLIGISPIVAGGLAAMQGLAIQESSTTFFQNGAQVGGILSSSLEMSDDDAKELRDYFNTEFGGKNRGKIAVVGGGLQYHGVTAKAVDSQLIEQLKWTADVVCSVYHVPPYKIGMGPVPANNNVQAQNIEYYSSCLQILIESIERCLDEGLGMDGVTLGTEFDTDALMRMDTATQYEVATKAKGIKTLDEQRKMVGVGKIKGGATLYLQQQDHSLAAIEARDRQLIANADNPPAPPANDNPPEVQAAYFGAMLRKNLMGAR